MKFNNYNQKRTDMKKITFCILICNLFVWNLIAQQNYSNRDVIPTEYKWDLTKIYTSWDAWEADIVKLQQELEEINVHKGTLAPVSLKKGIADKSLKGKNSSKPEILRQVLDTKFNMMNKATKLYSYVLLQRSVDGQNPEYSAKEQQLSVVLAQVEQDFAWFEPEFSNLDKEELFKWLQKYPELKIYTHYISDFFRQHEHILPEEQENMMTILNSAIYGSKEIYNTLAVADMQFEKVNLSTGEEVVANMQNMERYLTASSVQKDRKLIADANLKSFTKSKYTFATTYSNILKSRWAVAKIYKYPSCLNYVLDADSIPESVYTNFLEVAATGNIPTQKYFSLRKKALNLDTLYKSDLNISMLDFNKTYTWEEAVQLVKNSLTIFGEEYSILLDSLYVPGVIDVFPVPGKRPGGFNMNVPDVHPYILMNYNTTRANVFTLVHETGHSIHSILSDKNQPLVSRAFSVFIAEVAAIVNEFALLDYMVKNANTPEEKVDLLTQEINIFIGKIIRTAQLSEFEYNAYKRIENELPVDIESLSLMFDSIEVKYYGSELYREPDEKYGWFRTQHLYNKYFYIFQYATSYSAALSIFTNIKNETDEAKRQVLINNYLTLLKSGGSDYPIQLLKNAGIDMTTKKPYQDVITYINQLVEQLETELAKIE